MLSSPTPVLLMAQELTQGGSERQLTEIAKALDRRSFAPHVAVLRSGGLRLDELRAAGVPVVFIPLRSFVRPSLLSAAWQLNRYLRRNRIRLVHSFDVPSNMLLVPVARASRIPVVLSSQRAFRALSPKARIPLRMTDRMVDGIVVNCRAIERHLVEDEKVSAANIRLCYNGINTEVFERRRDVHPPQLSGASLVVGVVCALRPEKDLLTLVQAFALARRQHSGMRLLIVGSGAMQEPLEELIQKLDQREHCVFVPTTAEVPQWLSAIDIFVLPSVSEALSNSLMEAMACGCVAVASNVGGNPELIASGERGLLFPPRDVATLAQHLSTLAGDAALRQRYAEAGCRFIRDNFSVDASARRMADIYAEMLTRKS